MLSRTMKRSIFRKRSSASGRSITKIDKLIVTVAPWKLAKDPSPEAHQSLDRILYTALESLRIISGLVSPVLPHSAQRIWEQLGLYR